jgi:chromosome segregation ATPase
MPSIVDFSSAFPWLISGFIAGLLLFWLIRKLMGVDSRRAAELAAAQSALSDARRSASEMTNKAASLESEWARLTTENGQLQQRASLVQQLERQLSDLQQSSMARANQFEASSKELAALRESSAAEIAALRHDAEAHVNTSRYYEGEFNRLFAEHESINKDALTISDELQKTKSSLEAAARDAGEASRLKNELAAAKADIVALRADLDQRKGSEGNHAELLAKLSAESEAKLKAAAAENASLAAEARKHADSVMQLKTQLSSAPATGGGSAESESVKAELSKLTAALAAAKSTEHESAMALKSLQNDVQQFKKSLAESNLLAASRQDEILRLKSKVATAPGDADNYRRFKDALDAANRIAAGLPEKA